MQEPKTYHQMWIHREMLFDKIRCEAYKKAIFSLVKPGSVVLDAGTGTGIMAIFAAQAGAKKVYAVERTATAEIAREMINRNGLSNIIEVIQSDVVDVVLPEKVDVLISEWMGGFAVDENLLDPICIARDKWLKPNGIMIPDTVSIYLAPVFDEKLNKTTDFWNSKYYGVNLDLISQYMRSEIYNARHDLDENTLLAKPTLLWKIDTKTINHSETIKPFVSDFEVKIKKYGVFNALAAWFHADFTKDIILTNAPDAPMTHWGRTMMPLVSNETVKKDDIIKIKFECIPVSANLCDTKWIVTVKDNEQQSSGRQGCSASFGFC